MVDFKDSVFVGGINAPRIKHRALTGFLRKKWNRNPNVLKRIVYNCNVPAYLGALPPQLYMRVPREQIATVTAQFREVLEDFLIDNIFELREMKADKVYDLPRIGNLFGTKCQLMARGINVCGINPWSGLLGFVCKLSFPEINAHYALKLYYDNLCASAGYDHGPWFEAATALAANHAEAGDNVPMYMASLKYEKYLLSQWAGDNNDGIGVRDNKNKIFATSASEDQPRNRRGGRRIDWGQTYRTGYGALSYAARKIYRQAINMDQVALQKSVMRANNNFEGRDVADALELAGLVAWYDDNGLLERFLKRFQKQR